MTTEQVSSQLKIDRATLEALTREVSQWGVECQQRGDNYVARQHHLSGRIALAEQLLKEGEDAGAEPKQ